MTDPQRLPPKLRTFVDTEEWTFARTMPKWPHEYLARKRIRSDKRSELFRDLVRHIRTHGRPQRFYHLTLFYFEEDDHLYWTMVEKNPDGSWTSEVEFEEIINRCRKEDSYENREKAGTLPKDKAK